MHTEPPHPTAAAAEAASHRARARQALRDELAYLKSDLDALILHEASLSDDELGQAYARILGRLGTGGGLARDLAQESGPSGSPSYQAACAYVREQPLQSVMAAAAFGSVAGWLRPRR